MPWVFYSWNFSLSPEVNLAAKGLVERLRTFRSKQLAAYGYTALPLVAACVAEAGDGYHGLGIRHAVKPYGAGRQIDGQFRKDEPVVVIDDSLSSGTSFRAAVDVLEANGFEVEGLICLVNFPHRGGKEWALANGYRVEHLFDIWKDLKAPQAEWLPWRATWKPCWTEATAIPDGLHPAAVARIVAETMLTTGAVPRPPRSLDRQYDARGGVYVSFRDIHTDRRIARDGFWTFDGDTVDAASEVVMATAKTVFTSKASLCRHSLERLKIGITCFGPLQKIAPRDADFTRYGLVARSDLHGWKIGGALPNTQVFTSEQEQLALVVRNARLSTAEPYTLFRHEVHKLVEPGMTWLPYGVAARRDAAGSVAFGEALLDCATAVLRGKSPSRTTLDFPTSCYGVAVSIYLDGLIGCRISWGGDLVSCVARATKAAAADPRLRGKLTASALSRASLVVTLLHDREILGACGLTAAARKLRLGTDSLAVSSNRGRAIMLGSVAVHYSWSKKQFASKTVEKSGGPARDTRWATFATSSWLKDGEGVIPLRSGYPERGASSDPKETAFLLGSFITKHLGVNGVPAYQYDPLRDIRVWRGTAARMTLALNALARAGSALHQTAWQDAARTGLQSLLKMRTSGSRLLSWGRGADAQLIAACAGSRIVGREEAVAGLANGLFKSFDDVGGVRSKSPARRRWLDHDFYAGMALQALAVSAHGKSDRFRSLATHAREWQRRRFELLHPWGMVCWSAQAFSDVHRLFEDERDYAFAAEMADYACEHQLTNGSFVNSIAHNATFHTAVFLEGIAAVWERAVKLRDVDRATRYEAAWRAGLRFMDHLVIQKRDTYFMSSPVDAVGGVRADRTSSVVRIDYVGHMLLAVVRGLAALGGES